MSTFKLDGAKFSTLEDLKESMWPIYESRMSKADFDKYVEENAEKGE